VVDALVGSGQQGALRAPLDMVVNDVAASGVKVLAVDLPSGLDCDTGEPLGVTVRASHTATIVAAKVGFSQPSAKPYVGEVHVVDMGMPWKAWESVRS
jgi:NAD(P)H-hydrate epimerase